MFSPWRVPLTTLARIDRCAAARRPKNITLSDIEGLMLRKPKQARPEAFVKEAQWLQEEVPLRVAHLLVGFHRLPFIAMRCEPLAQVWSIYLEDFEHISALPRARSGEDVLDFKESLKTSQEKRAGVVAATRQAVGELQRFPDVRGNLETFLDKVFLTRIGRLLLEDHFIACVEHAASSSDPSSMPQSDGIVTELKLAPLLRTVADGVQQLSDEIYGQRAEVNIVEVGEATVHSIPRYLYFVFKEVMKNAIKATMEKHLVNPPPLQVTVVTGTYDVQVKISDRGGGMPRNVLKHIWRYGYSGFTSSHPESGSAFGAMGDFSADSQHELSGFGVGLPLSRLYTRYLGGDIQISQVLGHGTEVSIILSRHGQREEDDVGASEDYDGDIDSFQGGARSSIMAPP
mmetsp:Transcript_46081/g.128081  ORF Transcript_46081/g.128081 Transcript_46081/m.128081 type:complete len:401 (-) Transcript_46081:70-1272(-)